MGKNLIQQKRGKGSPTYRAPSFRYKGIAKYPGGQKKEMTGEVTDIIHCQGHSAPLISVKCDNGEEALLQAPEGIKVGDCISNREGTEVKPGNILPLKNIPEGVAIYNIEANAGDGGKFARASGACAKIITKMEDKVVVLLPSNKRKIFAHECRAMIGTVAGGGRFEKPLLKAGTMYHKMKARNKFYPIVSGTSMNAVCHPFGGKGSHTKGRPTQASRNAPPGRKVGKIAPKRTGRR